MGGVRTTGLPAARRKGNGAEASRHTKGLIAAIEQEMMKGLPDRDNSSRRSRRSLPNHPGRGVLVPSARG